MLIAYAPQGIPRLTEASLSTPVIAAASGLVLVTTMLVGLLPALQTLRRPGLQSHLGDGKGASSSRGSSVGATDAHRGASGSRADRARRCGAAGSKLDQAERRADWIRHLGDPERTARAALGAVRRTNRGARGIPDDPRTAAGSPGVALAALDSQPPLVGGGGSNGFIPEGRPARSGERHHQPVALRHPDYFRVLRVPLRAGRAFTDQDVRSAPLVMMINETLARAAFEGQDPIGKRIACCEGAPWKTGVEDGSGRRRRRQVARPGATRADGILSAARADPGCRVDVDGADHERHGAKHARRSCGAHACHARRRPLRRPDAAALCDSYDGRGSPPDDGAGQVQYGADDASRVDGAGPGRPRDLQRDRVAGRTTHAGDRPAHGAGRLGRRRHSAGDTTRAHACRPSACLWARPARSRPAGCSRINCSKWVREIRWRSERWSPRCSSWPLSPVCCRRCGPRGSNPSRALHEG